MEGSIKIIFFEARPTVSSYISALKSCIGSRDLRSARRIRKQLVSGGEFEFFNIFVANALLDTFAKCGSMLDAQEFFERMGSHVDVVSWNSLINGYVHNQQPQHGLEMLSRMHQEGLSPNARTFIAALKACAFFAGDGDDSSQGNQQVDRKLIALVRGFHAQATSLGYESDIFLANTLVDTYAKCGSLKDAQDIFDRMPEKSIVTWTALIMGYAQYGQSETALDLFAGMQQHSNLPNERTFVAALKACSSSAMKEDGVRVDVQVVKMKSLEKGMAVHAQLAHAGLESGQFVVSSLVDMYANCGSLDDANRIFHRSDEAAHDVVSWNSIIMAHAQCGEGERALELFRRMLLQRDRGEVIVPNSRSFISALMACSELSVRERAQRVEGKLAKLYSLEEGMKIHHRFGELGFESNMFVANSLIDMYSKSGSMSDAQNVFDRILEPNVISWTALISGYAQNGDGQKALELFVYVKNNACVLPNARTFVAALNACAAVAVKEEVDEKLMIKVGSMEKLLAIHADAAKLEHLSHLYLQSSLVNAYSRCGSMEDACREFWSSSRRDLVSWNSMILGYAQAGDTSSALELFELMRREEAVPDGATYVAVLKACGNSQENLRRGEEIHEQLVESGYGSQSPLVGNTLVDMYAKCGSLEMARKVFEEMEMKNRDAVSWNAILSGYAQSSKDGHAEEALRLFGEMLEEGFAPDEVTFIPVLRCCGALAALQTGKEIHHEMQELGLLLLNRADEEDEERRKRGVILGTCLVDFYGKCGSMIDAMEVFESMQTRNTVTWNAALAGFAQQGDASRVLELFERMRVQDRLNKPNRITLLILLTACSHAGMVDRANEIFSEMSSSPLGYSGVVPDVEHYSCMVDMLGRANHLNEALEMLDRVPFVAGKTLWLTLLSACQKWGNVEIGRIAFQRVTRLDEQDGCAYVLMSNIYASAGQRSGDAAIRQPVSVES